MTSLDSDLVSCSVLVQKSEREILINEMSLENVFILLILSRVQTFKLHDVDVSNELKEMKGPRGLRETWW